MCGIIQANPQIWEKIKNEKIEDDTTLLIEGRQSPRGWQTEYHGEL